MSQENKAAIFDIVNYHSFWSGDNLESYRDYMDITEDEKNVFGQQKYINDGSDEKNKSLDELAQILSDMYTSSAAERNQVAAIHVFGIKFGKEIIENGFNAKEVIEKAGLNETYVVELNKALKI